MTMFTSRRPQRSRAAGFTLVELLVVLVILGLLAGIVGPNLIGKTETANIRTTKTQIEQLGAALDMFRLEVGRYPSGSEGLEALIERPSDADRWNGPYLKKNVIPKDAWGNEFIYRQPGEHGAYDLVSYGPDASPGGEGNDADIVSWQ